MYTFEHVCNDVIFNLKDHSVILLSGTHKGEKTYVIYLTALCSCNTSNFSHFTETLLIAI